jgi:hypothetical protein
MTFAWIVLSSLLKQATECSCVGGNAIQLSGFERDDSVRSPSEG